MSTNLRLRLRIIGPNWATPHTPKANKSPQLTWHRTVRLKHPNPERRNSQNASYILGAKEGGPLSTPQEVGPLL